MKKHRQKLRRALQQNRVVILSGPLGSDVEQLANEVVEEVWIDHVRSSAVNLSSLEAAASGVVLHELERLLGAKDRSAFFSLLDGTRPLLMTCDRDWLEDVRYALFDRPIAVISLPEVVELPYVRDLSARLSDNLPMGAREFRERLRNELPTLGKAMVHPLVVKWTLMEWLDEQYRTHSRCIRQVTAEQSITFHFRRALRAWVEETVASDLEESVRLFSACLRDKRIRPVVRYDVLKVLFESNQFSLILDRSRSDLFSDHRKLLKETFEFLRQRRVTNAPLVQLVKFLDRNKVLFDSYDHRWVLEILHYWFEGVTDEEPYPEGSEEAASLANEWLERFNTPELQALFKECLKLIARIPLHSRALLEKIEAVRRYDLLQQVTREDPSLLPILKRDLPGLAIFQAKPASDTAEKPPQPKSAVKMAFCTPTQQPGDALVQWARARLVDGLDGDRPWKAILQEAMEIEADPSDLVSRVGTRLVAAICGRHHWSEITRAQREWILSRLEESILQSFDDWSESNQAQRFFFSPDRQSARAVVTLLGQGVDETHRLRLLRILPHSLFHPSEEVRRYTALALGSNRQDLDPDLIARCASIIVEEDHLRETMDRHTLSWELCKTFTHRTLQPKPTGRTIRYPETRLRLKLLEDSGKHISASVSITEFEIDRYFLALESQIIGSEITLSTDETPAPSTEDFLAESFWQRLEEACRMGAYCYTNQQNQLFSELLHLRKVTPGVLNENESRVELTRRLLDLRPEDEQKHLILESLDMTHLDH